MPIKCTQCLLENETDVMILAIWEACFSLDPASSLFRVAYGSRKQEQV